MNQRWGQSNTKVLQTEQKKQIKKIESFVILHVSFLSYGPQIVQKSAYL